MLRTLGKGIAADLDCSRAYVNDVTFVHLAGVQVLHPERLLRSLHDCRHRWLDAQGRYESCSACCPLLPTEAVSASCYGCAGCERCQKRIVVSGFAKAPKLKGT
jgi:hypothetical protein